MCEALKLWCLGSLLKGFFFFFIFLNILTVYLKSENDSLQLLSNKILLSVFSRKVWSALGRPKED